MREHIAYFYYSNCLKKKYAQAFKSTNEMLICYLHVIKFQKRLYLKLLLFFIDSFSHFVIQFGFYQLLELLFELLK